MFAILTKDTFEQAAVELLKTITQEMWKLERSDKKQMVCFSLGNLDCNCCTVGDWGDSIW